MVRHWVLLVLLLLALQSTKWFAHGNLASRDTFETFYRLSTEHHKNFTALTLSESLESQDRDPQSDIYISKASPMKLSSPKIKNVRSTERRFNTGEVKLNILFKLKFLLHFYIISHETISFNRAVD
ncbi:hypothetical protein K450DRAFT_228575 [Umbelopsis ramanniana AG]|uniref:Uncharacterized protein n=1 Tax=Umbelopsis ramanniana AG TaxID=1314678 RepID=A0AAD5EEE6_UMBRA|nr:uncharacterized protein K450DRAFT_228575 [Umbelopsis ramanniana AG]KAI8582358.1 hypothetical protein K450DRAFT_228575 [Umbelopsis ramanniana AG]